MRLISAGSLVRVQSGPPLKNKMIFTWPEVSGVNNPGDGRRG
jgi:hypothetical protein